MKVLISGTHFTPAQAVIEELKEDPSVEVVYLGRRHTREGDPTPSVESQVLPDLGVRFLSLTTGRLQRAFTRYTIPSLMKIPIGLIQSFFYLLKESPDVVLLFGGYLSVPVALSAWILSKPIIIHEQTLVVGLANKICSLFADRIAVSFKFTHKFNNQKVILTGNPIRKELLIEDRRVNKEYQQIVRIGRRENLPIILIMGGNQGSHTINSVVEQSLSRLSERACIIHQGGDSNYQDYERLVTLQGGLDYPKRYLVKKWIDVQDLSFVYRHINLVVSRAGANTLYELAIFNLPSVLIPVPYLHDDEQMVNARYFRDLGLARIIPQGDLSADTLVEVVNDALKTGPQETVQLDKIVVKDGAKRLALEVKLLANSGL